jgi:hypothetical protein
MLKKGASEKKIKQIRFDDFVDDTKKIVSYFRDRNLYENIFIIGHSQGSLVGMLAATKNVDGFISIAGAGKTIDNIIVEQIEKMGANKLVESAKSSFEILSKGKVDKNFNPALENVFNLDTQPFMINWMTYSPTKEIKKLNIPVLIINGTNDIQVSTEEARLLNENGKNAKLVLIKDMNHVFKTVKSNDTQENTKTYNMPLLKNTPELSEAIIKFIKN